MNISIRLKQARECKGLSLSDLSILSGIAKSTLQRYETGTTKKIPMEAIATIEQVLNLPTGYLMGWEENVPVCTPLKILRQKANLPLMELCEQYNEKYSTNLSYDALRLIEDGKSIPTGKILVNLADFFNVSVDYILGRHSADISNTNNLTKNEREHLRLFSMLNNAGQKKASEYISDLLENTKYTQEDEFIDCDEKIYSVDIEDDTTYIAAYGGGVENDDNTIYHT